MGSPSHDITEALGALRDGDEAAADRLARSVYDELARLAHAQRRRERPDHTLDTSALVHEAYVKLLGPSGGDFNNRAHFFAAAARAMRQVLVDYARARNSLKRGEGQRAVSLETENEAAQPLVNAALLTDDEVTEVLDLDDALARLADLDARQARVVECRYFGGLSVEETAEALDLSTATVKRDWRAARAWLYAELSGRSDG